MPAAVGDIWLISFVGAAFNQRIMFTHTMRVTAGTSAEPNVVISQAFVDSFKVGNANHDLVNAYLDCLGTSYVLDRVRCQVIHPFRQVYSEAILNQVATGVGVALETITTTPITLVTNDVGRDQIAVKHVGPTPNGGVAGSAPTASQIIRLDALALELLEPRNFTAEADVIQLDPVIFHRGTGQWDQVVDYRISDRAGTERRRILRVGE